MMYLKYLQINVLTAADGVIMQEAAKIRTYQNRYVYEQMTRQLLS